MSNLTTDITATAPPAARPATAEPPFGVNELRLTASQWLATATIVLIFMAVAPYVASRVEPLKAGADYRIPYTLSKDYWLYQRRLEQFARPDQILLLGDSVVWGEYVRADGTLSHFLNAGSGQSDRFINGGVNGLFPLAMEGLVNDYAGPIRGRKVIVHCNLLWMTSPKADLSTSEEENFNHSRLVPQFFPRIPCYRADANERLSATIDNHIGYLAWTDHLQYAYYDGRSLPAWTLEEDNREPPGYPNTWRNPLPPLRTGVPGEPANDPQRGPTSRRHRPWTSDGGEPTYFEWVEPSASLQWHALLRVIHTLQEHGDDVLVLLGPFNEYMIAPDQQAQYRSIRDTIAETLSENGVVVLRPEVLPSELYADASHPLTDGYAKLAAWMLGQEAFQKWSARPTP
jgi:hypothetical protein